MRSTKHLCNINIAKRIISAGLQNTSAAQEHYVNVNIIMTLQDLEVVVGVLYEPENHSLLLGIH